MATNLITTFRPIGMPVNALPDSNRAKKQPQANWWAPLFGWPSEPDYIEPEAPGADPEQNPVESEKPVRTRFKPASFTEEKARRLRMLTTETASFHDVMYHSAIASRLASDFKRPPDSS